MAPNSLTDELLPFSWANWPNSTSDIPPSAAVLKKLESGESASAIDEAVDADLDLVADGRHSVPTEITLIPDGDASKAVVVPVPAVSLERRAAVPPSGAAPSHPRSSTR